ncbi:hypothetical protein [Alkalihalophilus marmarensis]|uniref:Uncharacterized protein n=1 Tax=Alkalihalophilus marmarensis DSM 21297 TaxID=1188261 RepID=U6SK17_9BACI|nr:hypothetical protein [Alkalihalophilus marmarensis]ERN51908.1 hypothetical protein A33I_19030 [Alkalihalophilus marmarensis DSM 21297]
MKLFNAFVLCVLTFFAFLYASFTIIDYGSLLAQHISLFEPLADFFSKALFVLGFLMFPLLLIPVFPLIGLFILFLCSVVIAAYSKDWSRLGGLLLGALIGIFVLKLVDIVLMIGRHSLEVAYFLPQVYSPYIGIIPLLFMIAGLIWFKHIMKWIHLGGITLGATISFFAGLFTLMVFGGHWFEFLQPGAVHTLLLLVFVAAGMTLGNCLGFKKEIRTKEDPSN